MEKMLGNKKYILIFILPALLLFLGFTLIPLVTSGIYSFFEYNGIGTKTFIGIKNYIQLFTEDRYFPLAVKNSLILVVASVFIQLPISLILALVLSRGVKGDGFFRTVYFIPVVISSTEICRFLTASLIFIFVQIKEVHYAHIHRDHYGPPGLGQYTPGRAEHEAAL